MMSITHNYVRSNNYTRCLNRILYTQTVLPCIINIICFSKVTGIFALFLLCKNHLKPNVNYNVIIYIVPIYFLHITACYMLTFNVQYGHISICNTVIYVNIQCTIRSYMLTFNVQYSHIC